MVWCWFIGVILGVKCDVFFIYDVDDEFIILVVGVLELVKELYWVSIGKIFWYFNCN